MEVLILGGMLLLAVGAGGLAAYMLTRPKAKKRRRKR